jgi:hypothetical protein
MKRMRTSRNPATPSGTEESFNMRVAAFSTYYYNEMFTGQLHRWLAALVEINVKCSALPGEVVVPLGVQLIGYVLMIFVHHMNALLSGLATLY